MDPLHPGEDRRHPGQPAGRGRRQAAQVLDRLQGVEPVDFHPDRAAAAREQAEDVEQTGRRGEARRQTRKRSRCAAGRGPARGQERAGEPGGIDARRQLGADDRGRQAGRFPGGVEPVEVELEPDRGDGVEGAFLRPAGEEAPAEDGKPRCARQRALLRFSRRNEKSTARGHEPRWTSRMPRQSPGSCRGERAQPFQCPAVEQDPVRRARTTPSQASQLGTGSLAPSGPAAGSAASAASRPAARDPVVVAAGDVLELLVGELLVGVEQLVQHPGVDRVAPLVGPADRALEVVRELPELLQQLGRRRRSSRSCSL